MNNVIIHTGQDKTNDNWVWGIDLSDDRFYNIRTIKWQPKNLEDIEREYNIRIEVQ